MEINPDALIEERLRQKYRELDEIMKGKTVKTNTITRQYIGQMEMLREQYHMVSHGLAPPGVILPRSMSQELRVKGHLDQSSRGRQRPLSGGSYNSKYGCWEGGEHVGLRLKCNIIGYSHVCDNTIKPFLHDVLKSCSFEN